MRLLKCWTRGIALLIVLNGAAFADVTVSQTIAMPPALNIQLAARMTETPNPLGTRALAITPPATRTAGEPPAYQPAAFQLAAFRNAAFRGPALMSPAFPTSEQADVVKVRYEKDWLARQPLTRSDAEWLCLATALYFEARGETVKGQFAVAEVILNRADSPAYPETICGVVNQKSGKSCQFSYTCNGHSKKIREPEAFAQAGKIAAVMLAGAPRALTDGATHFHTKNVRPGWAHRFPRTATIGAHLFYRQPSGA
ncbi:cell wall hydrolase [Fertoebacter nigrum]|uniref:Cell wall hydrolase n=1 Tax=Fertoeibacter niger TaxID=2656921 RepID=A0A8X8KPI4_9RHOB|nr:cell wall hydrolase [Fertoeibacter niger]NUB45150.1 cell wall hydrolase [Fertoeibacter niger]